MTIPCYASMSEAYTDGHAAGWSEAGAWLAGAAAGTDDPKARAAYWRAHLFCVEQVGYIRNPPDWADEVEALTPKG